MFLIYDLVFLIYGLFYLPYLLLTRRAYAGYAMRFGFFPSSVKKAIRLKPNIWVHAVSVGEVIVLDGFIQQLKKRCPHHQIIATVTTKTGYELALKRLAGNAVVIPSPLDLSWIAARFIRLIQPKAYIAAETEIWPNVYDRLFRRHIPMAIINGRISDASFGRYQRIRWLLKGILNQVSLFCMQSPLDARRIIALGAPQARVIVSGNLKFDGLPQPLEETCPDFGLTQGQLLWIAGSTHPGEEAIVLEVYLKVIKDHPQWRLVIAPRHIERSGEVVGTIEGHGLKAVKFSQCHLGPLDADAVVVVDTIGHLRSLYARASLVFVGKSLCVGGGQNIIEPASYGKAIVIGPKMGNFKDIAACFQSQDAVVQVTGPREFEAAVRDLMRNALKREELGRRAKEVVSRNQGATRRSLDHIADFIT